MAIRTAPLNLLTFPQHWNAAAKRLTVRYLCFPRLDPDIPLAPGKPSFADAALAFELNVIPSLSRLPRSADATEIIDGPPAGAPLKVSIPPADKAQAFEALQSLLNIQPRSPGIPPGPRPARRILKPQTQSWRTLVGDREPGRFLIGEDATACALHESLAGQPKEPQTPPAIIRWGAAMALALRTEPIAEALGLIGSATITLPAKLLDEGGWVYLGLHSSSDYADDPTLVNLQAARIPPLRKSRPLYASTLFPVDQSDFVADEAITDASDYSNGFARLVHAAQEFEERSDQLPGQGDGDAIHLAWDDEQVTEWLNRQTNPDAGTPMGTIGYRVDVRDLTGDSKWHSLQQVSSIGHVKLGELDLGSWTGERPIEIVPLRRKPGPSNEFWLPSFFATWRGSSLVMSDHDFIRLQQVATPLDEDYPELGTHLQNREKAFAPVISDGLQLLYGHRYDFRVRLADLSFGGPRPDVETPDDPDGRGHFTAEVQFVRRRRPGSVDVSKLPTRDEPWLVVARPKLRFPELRFAGDELLNADADAILSGKPDPDVGTLAIRLEVKSLAGERVEWQPLYTVNWPFPEAALTVPLSINDVAQLANLMAPEAGEPLPIPAERELRLVLVAIGKGDEGYFADEQSRMGMPTFVPLKADARSEAELIKYPSDPLVSFFLRAPAHDETAPRPIELLAKQLDLPGDGLSLTGQAGMRTIMSCSASLRHTPSPERHSLVFSSDADLRQRWINVLTFEIKRDWTWLGLASKGLSIERSVGRVGAAPEWRPITTIQLPMAAADKGLPETDGATDTVRQSTRCIIFDAISPLDVYSGEHPYELEAAYRITPQLAPGILAAPPPEPLHIRLPVATPPRQVPRLVSAGIALSPFEHENDYSATMERKRHLWLEFDAPPADPGDSYFARVLALAPDPLLVGAEAGISISPEPALPLDAEWLRRIIPSQSADKAGYLAMPDRLSGGREAHYVLVPLPAELNSDSPELTGMFTYEVRLGHSDGRWSTAHGRWGPALRITGVQHPPPQLHCEAARLQDRIIVSAPFACPVHDGQSVQPRDPLTKLWALLYARVAQADGKSFRNLLLARMEMRRTDEYGQWVMADGAAKGVGAFSLTEVERELAERGLPADAPLTVLAAEFFTDPEVAQPVGQQLGDARLMRASTLVPVPRAC